MLNTPRNEWEETIIDACVVCHLPWATKTPKQALEDLIAWNCEVALDPAVSEEAQRLIDKGRVLGRSEILQQLGSLEYRGSTISETSDLCLKYRINLLECGAIVDSPSSKNGEAIVEAVKKLKQDYDNLVTTINAHR